MKGIILAGGSGLRLHPCTKIVNKHFLMLYDNPMIYYPLSTLINFGIKEICLISDEKNLDSFKKLFDFKKDFKLEYKIQDKPNGVAEAFLICEKFIGNDSVCLILGDNIFYPNNNFFETKIPKKGALAFACKVKQPEQYGVVHFERSKIKKIEEKPKTPKSNYAITGLYFYDNDVLSFAKKIKPSKRGELEITDINKEYLKKGKLKIKKIKRKWIDAGTFDRFLDASIHIRNNQLQYKKYIEFLGKT